MPVVVVSTFNKETVVACVHRVIDTDVVDADLSRGVMFEEIPK